MNKGSDESQMITVDEAKTKGVKLFQKLSRQDSGKLWSYEGSVMPW